MSPWLSGMTPVPYPHGTVRVRYDVPVLGKICHCYIYGIIANFHSPEAVTVISPWDRGAPFWNDHQTHIRPDCITAIEDASNYAGW